MFLLDWEFFKSLVKQGYNVEANSEIIQHLAWEDQKMSKWLLDVIMEAIWTLRLRKNYLWNCFNALSTLLQIKDPLQHWRIALALNYKDNGFLQLIYDLESWEVAGYKIKTDSSLEFLLTLIRSNPLCAGWMYYTREFWGNAVFNILKQKMRTSTFAEGLHYSRLIRHFRNFKRGRTKEEKEGDWKNFNLDDYCYDKLRPRQRP